MWFTFFAAFSSLARNILAVVFFHNHNANGEFSDTSMGLPRSLSQSMAFSVAQHISSYCSLSRRVRLVFLDIIHCSIFRRHIIRGSNGNVWVSVCSYGFNSVVEKLRTCQQGRKRARECWEKGGIENYKHTVVAVRYPICQWLHIYIPPASHPFHFKRCLSPRSLCHLYRSNRLTSPSKSTKLTYTKWAIIYSTYLTEIL